MSPQEQWQLAGAAPDTYERHVVPALFVPWARSLVATAALRPRERVLDVACGTGVVARFAAERVGAEGRVVGLDMNAGMLEVARARTPGIEWREGSATEMPLTDAAFDVVLCQQGLQFFPDRPAALREMRRVLAPGGRLALSVWRSLEHSPGHRALAEALERHIGADAGAIMRAPFSLGEAATLSALVTRAGFREVAVQTAVEDVCFPSVDEFPLVQAGATPAAALVARASPRARAALVRDVKAALASYVRRGKLVWPIQAHVVTARA